MTRTSITGRVLAGHKQAAVEVPFDPATRWGIAAISIRRGRRGHPVRVSLAGVSFSSFIVARSKRFWLLLEDEQLAATGISLDDEVTMDLEPALS